MNTTTRGFSSLIMLLVLVAIVLIGATYWYQQRDALSPSNPETPVDIMNSHKVTASDTGYKQAFLGGEIPSNWSAYQGPDSAPAVDLQALANPSQLNASFALGTISSGDGAFEQVDFYFLTKSGEQALIDQAKKEGDQITQENVGGVTATVIHYPTDNGQIDKNGTGGEDYIIGSGKSPSGLNKFLLMRNWSLGSTEFKNGFTHFLRTVKFTSGW